MTDSQTHTESNKTENCIHVLVVLNVWYTTYGFIQSVICGVFKYCPSLSHLACLVVSYKCIVIREE